MIEQFESKNNYFTETPEIHDPISEQVGVYGENLIQTYQATIPSEIISFVMHW